MYPTTGFTPTVSQQELDEAQRATLAAMVDEYPENEYWRNMQSDFLERVERLHDNNWLSDTVIIPTAEKVTVIPNGRGSIRYPLVENTNNGDLRGEMFGQNARSGISQELIF